MAITRDKAAAARQYADLHEHLHALDAAGLLQKIDAPINRETELMPLVRWQFRGGIPEAERKAFLFTGMSIRWGGASTCRWWWAR